LRDRLPIAGGFTSFLDLDQLLQATRPDPTMRDTTSGLIDHQQLAVAHKIVLVAVIQMASTQSQGDDLFTMTTVQPQSANGASLQREFFAPRFGQHCLLSRTVEREIVPLSHAHSDVERL